MNCIRRHTSEVEGSMIKDSTNYLGKDKAKSGLTHNTNPQTD